MHHNASTDTTRFKRYIELEVGLKFTGNNLESHSQWQARVDGTANDLDLL
jgi:hypothetical protein